MESIEELRKQLDEIDGQLVKLFEQRMDVCARVGAYKIKNGRKVLDRPREKEKLQDVAGRVSSEPGAVWAADVHEQKTPVSAAGGGRGARPAAFHRGGFPRDRARKSGIPRCGWCIQPGGYEGLFRRRLQQFLCKDFPGCYEGH